MLDQQLETFICVKENNSFTKAAERLYLSPTSVIKRINTLELQLGFTLFERSAQGVMLTPAGDIFYKYSKDIIKTLHEAVERAKEVSYDTSVTIRIGNILGFPDEFVNSILPEIIQSCDKFNLSFINYSPDRESLDVMISELGDKIDIIMDVFEPEFVEHLKLNIDTLDLLTMDMECMLSPQHPLASKQRLKISDLYGTIVYFP